MMKLLAVYLILTVAVLHCVRAANVAVGLYAPDRYDGIPDMCLMPMDFGYCRAKVKRYYFDMRRMKCTVFYWGGCAGNINNFKSLDECNKHCLDAYEDEVGQRDPPATNYNENTRSYAKGVAKPTVAAAIGGSTNSNFNSNSNSNNSNSTFSQYKNYKNSRSYTVASSQQAGDEDYDN